MASGAGKRIAKSAVDWARFSKVCPKYQAEMLRTVKGKHDSFMNKVHQLPESLPKIDFASYKARLPNPAMADKFQQSYEALSIPFPVDKGNMMQKVEDENKAKAKAVQDFVTAREDEIKTSKVFLEKMKTLPKYEEMTEEMMNYYFPETAEDLERPTFWPHIPEEQPYNPEFKYIK